MRRINFTRRLRLTDADVQVRRLRPVEGRLAFEISADFARLKKHHSPEVSDGALLAAEAHIGSRSERFDCGTVSAPRLGGHVSAQFADEDRVLFRFKVVDAVSNPGRLLALRPMIRSGENDNPHGSLIGFDVRPLDGVPFKVDFVSLSEPPVLVLNRELDEADVARVKLFARSNGTFLSLVLPAAAREILTRFIVVDSVDPTETDATPQAHDLWYRFAQQYSVQPLSELFPDGTKTDRLDWIDVVVAGMARDWKSVARLRDAILEEK